MSWCHYARAQGKCVKQWRLHSLKDKQPITRKFFRKISEDCNFLIVFENSENSEKYPLPKNTRSIVDEEGSKSVPDKSLNYGTLRATDIPTVARLCPPRPSTLEKEKILDNIKGV